MSFVHTETTKAHQHHGRIVASGGLALLIAMGVGRFAYTPILPLMQSQTHFSNTTAGYLASSNYLGYLLGAFAVGALSWIQKHRTLTYRLSLILCIAMTGAMSISSNDWIWSADRFISGTASGLVYVLVSSIVLDELAKQNRSFLSGVLYGGVGIGIVITGMLVPVSNHASGWRGTWLDLMFLGVFLGIPALWLTDRSGGLTQSQSTVKTKAKRSGFFYCLMIAYGFGGVGYIITGTFLVELISKMPTLHGFAPYAWMIVGAAAAPSCIIWTYLGRRFGDIASLVTAYLLQLLGILLPIVMPDAVGGCVGALLFGGTFMGITTLATTYGRKLSPNDGGKAIGIMTGVFGVGQIVGAGGAGMLASRSGGFDVPTMAAGAALLIGAIILTLGRILTRTNARKSTRSFRNSGD